MSFKENLKKRRESSGLSMRQLGNQSMLTATCISQLEAGTRDPLLKTLDKLAQAFNITISELIGETRKEPMPQVNRFFVKFSILQKLKKHEQQMILKIAEMLQNRR